MAKRGGREVVRAEGAAPFRHRHDGWTAARQARFLERLAETGCVREACAAAGLSSTSGYRAYARMPDFAAAWDRALAARRPMLEDAAFERATRGVAVPITRGGKVVGQRQRFSDGLLRYLLERGDRREAAAARAAAEARVIEARVVETRRDPPGPPGQAQLDAELMKRLDEAAKRTRGELPPWPPPTEAEKAPMAEWFASMAPYGWTPPEGWDEGN